MNLSYTALILAAATGPLSSQTRPAVTLRVVNEAGVEARILESAKREAAGILKRADVGILWLDCEAGHADWRSANPCQRDRGPAEFWLRIAAKRPQAAVGEMLAFTELGSSGDGLAGVYYPAIAAMATPDRPPLADILGAAIVHEVGHLILGADAHSPGGVMKAFWGKEQFRQIAIDELGFSADQARKLRSELLRRSQ